MQSSDLLRFWRGTSSDLWLVLLLLLVVPLHSLFATDAKYATLLSGQFDITAKDCSEQIPAGKVDDCIAALRKLDALVEPTTDGMQDLKMRIGHRLQIAEAYKTAGTYGGERRDLYFKTLFSAYAKLPEKYFPYDEVLPLWNLYLREDVGRSKFSRYRKLRLIVRGDKGDKALEEAYFAQIQARILEFGFNLLDPTSSASNPDVLLKLAVKGELAEGFTDPRLQNKKVYRLTLDVSSFKFVSAQQSVEPFREEIEEAATQVENAKATALKRGTDRISNLLFYHCLREMFHSS